MEIKNERIKFNIYDPFLQVICEQDDKTAGKLIKLISEYVLYDIIPKGSRRDRAELLFYAYFNTIKTYKSKSRKKKTAHIIIYSPYAEFFCTMADDAAGRLLKKITDETLETSYLKDIEHRFETSKDYNLILALYGQYRSDCVTEGIKAKHDFSKIKADFNNINWYGFDKNKEPFKSVDCVKLYDYITRLPQYQTYDIDELVQAFTEDW